MGCGMRQHRLLREIPTLVVSIAGGHRDTKYALILHHKNIVEGRYNYLHVWTGAMDGMGRNDHDSSCGGQLIIVLAQTLMDLLDTENNGGQFVYDKFARYSVIKRGLIGNQVDDLFNDAPIFEHHISTKHPDYGQSWRCINSPARYQLNALYEMRRADGRFA